MMASLLEIYELVEQLIWLSDFHLFGPLKKKLRG